MLTRDFAVSAMDAPGDRATSAPRRVEVGSEREKSEQTIESTRIAAARDDTADKAGGGKRNSGHTNSTGLKSTLGQAAPSAVFQEVLSWVACDKCEKWRQLSEESLAQYQDKAFHCSYLPGVDCDTPEEVFHDMVERDKLLPGKSGKRVVCPTCRVSMERGQKGREKVSSVLERHYRFSAVCRPLEATTPLTVASLIIDLSDRLPYRAVEHEVCTDGCPFPRQCDSFGEFTSLANSLHSHGKPNRTVSSSLFVARSLCHAILYPLGSETMYGAVMKCGYLCINRALSSSLSYSPVRTSLFLPCRFCDLHAWHRICRCGSNSRRGQKVARAMRRLRAKPCGYSNS